jgi:hypothetical protein
VANRIRRAVLVATSSGPGRELADAVRDRAARKGFTLDVLTNPRQPDMARAIVRYDVVILDATVEHDAGSNYPGLIARPQAKDHVLVVSRTPLPLNFHGLREGGAPPYPASFTNKDILAWLDTQLEELRESRVRSRLERTLIGSALTMGKSGPARRGPGRRAFVSYRQEALSEARELAARLSSGDMPGPAGAPLTVILLEPGEIAFDDEILTSELRWHLASLLEERLRTCDSLWICDSPSYATSWWTRAELVLCRYVNGIAIWRYDPATGEASAADGMVPALTGSQRRRLDRLLSNSGRPVGAETADLSGQLGEVPALRRSSFWNDDVFTGDFANVPLLDVAASHGTGYPLTTEDVDGLLHAQEEEFVVVPPDVLAAAIPGHPAEFSGYRISREALPRYWLSRTPVGHAVRAGRRAAPAGRLVDGLLEPLPVFRAVKIDP